MFGHLDLNNDGLLSAQELYDLEHDQNERCIKPFIDACSMDQDSMLSPREWCRCFEKTDRPCAAVRRRLSNELLGSYAPDCDAQGFYKATQCHSSVGVCWCVDKHGVEFANTRTRGNKPDCGEWDEARWWRCRADVGFWHRIRLDVLLQLIPISFLPLPLLPISLR